MKTVRLKQATVEIDRSDPLLAMELIDEIKYPLARRERLGI